MELASLSVGVSPGSQSEKEGEAAGEGSGEGGAVGDGDFVCADSVALDGWRMLRRSKSSQTKKEPNSFLERSYATMTIRNPSESWTVFPHSLYGEQMCRSSYLRRGKETKTREGREGSVTLVPSGKYPRVRTQLVNATILGHSRGNLAITHLMLAACFRFSVLGSFEVYRSRM